MNKKIELFQLIGNKILPYIAEIAKLRIQIFHEWPYLYEGCLEYEKKHLQTYTKTQESLVIIAKHGNRIIGAVTGVPAKDSMQEVQKALENASFPLETTYYLGEILLLDEYRGSGIGSQLYRFFEDSVRKKNRYHTVVLCEINRSDTDKRKPLSYEGLDVFWHHFQYKRSAKIKTSFSYQEIGSDKETPHPMVFWEKHLIPFIKNNTISTK
ncbi:MAG: GNAT family N-acetyltransferase [Simkaniaceae bacterium]|nr:MAG: GNAT family N-acetyltransferase [Simkaniaceae bacterium]